NNLSDKAPESVCIRCGRCIEVCPIGLLPYEISKAVNNHNLDELNKLGTLNCIECGSCAYICPGRLPLLDSCKLGKIELKKLKRGK
ncbi:MAG: 4Fe-4S dicluster domain-containing protein, partial [Alphaproteobacteria bacterium]|nr:4Fe-4S dicluster domain-containing protein [Alphaproteobacteria bacterium]